MDTTIKERVKYISTHSVYDYLNTLQIQIDDIEKRLHILNESITKFKKEHEDDGK